MRADPTDVFDTDRFLTDVADYRTRRRHTLHDITDLSGVPISTVCGSMSRKQRPTLNTVVRLAVYADLDLNRYVTVDPNTIATAL